MRNNKKTRKNAAQNAPTHHPDKNKIQKKQERGEKYIRADEISEGTQEADSARDEYDQDSRISFDDDDEDSTASQEDDLEDWI